MKNSIKKMIRGWLLVQVIFIPIMTRNIYRANGGILQVYLLLLAAAIQLGGYVIFSRIQEQTSTIKIVTMTIATAACTIPYFHCPASMLVLLFPTLYAVAGFSNMKKPTNTQSIALYVSTAAIFSGRQLLYYKAPATMYPQSIWIDIIFFTTALYESIYMYGEMFQENTFLERNILEVRDKSKKDVLTGLYNRATMDAELEELSQEISTFSIAMFDIDNFKKVNDTYGHAFGDNVLKGLAETMQKSIKKTDKAFRYGGEEFLIILPRTELQGAVTCAERIRQTFAERGFVNGEKELHFTVSVGVVDCKHRQYKTITDLIMRCDEMLYAAKRNGKNQVQSKLHIEYNAHIK